MECYGKATRSVIARLPVQDDGTITLSGRLAVPSMEVR
jgi:hypothetical protein